jgi:hypothetical protein
VICISQLTMGEKDTELPREEANPSAYESRQRHERGKELIVTPTLPKGSKRLRFEGDDDAASPYEEESPQKRSRLDAASAPVEQAATSTPHPRRLTRKKPGPQKKIVLPPPDLSNSGLQGMDASTQWEHSRTEESTTIGPSLQNVDARVESPIPWSAPTTIGPSLLDMDDSADWDYPRPAPTTIDPGFLDLDESDEEKYSQPAQTMRGNLDLFDSEYIRVMKRSDERLEREAREKEEKEEARRAGYDSPPEPTAMVAVSSNQGRTTR